MMGSGGMVRDLVWELSFTVMVMCITEHGGMILFMERYGSCFHRKHHSCEMETLANCFSDSQLAVKLYPY